MKCVFSFPLRARRPASAAGASRRKGPREPVPTQLVLGPENQLASHTLRRLLHELPLPGGVVVFAGPAGCGKSHLVQGLASHWRRRGKSVLCLCGADFIREYSEAVQTRDQSNLYRHYRQADLLVLEDLRQLTTTPSTYAAAAQRELAGVVEDLEAQDGQVVVTSDAAPAAIPGLDPMLRSRLAAGLLVPLVPPSPATRLALVERLAADHKLLVEPGAAPLLAEALHTPTLLRGALLQLEHEYGRVVTPAAVQDYLAAHRVDNERSLSAIAESTARWFGLKPAALRSASRQRTVVKARGIAMYVARQLTSHSLQQIGQYFGGRDHSTVLHGCRKTASLLQSDLETQRVVSALLAN